MSLVVTTDYELQKIAAPNLPLAPVQYSPQYVDQLNNILRLYFNRIDSVLGNLMASGNSVPVTFPGMESDAFGRLRVSNPFTIFDSQNRYQKDNQFDESTANGASISYDVNESTVLLNVATTAGSKAVRQTFRVFPYQPGKSLLILATFAGATPQANLRQRLGFFNTENGVFFQKSGTINSFVLRSSASGTPNDSRTIAQANWNGDKLDGTGASGITLDTSKAQILFTDFEWLGVGSVRCGFVIDGQFIVCHTFENANNLSGVYMTTAILPIRYEIEALATLASPASMKQICSSVISEGGYQQAVATQFARRTVAASGFSTTFVPLVSIRLASDSLGSVVLIDTTQVFPTTTQNYEIVLLKNATLTGASYNTTAFNHVDFDVTATAVSGGTIVSQNYTASTSQSRASVITPSGYNFDLQLGVSLSGVSDVYTLAIRTLSATPTGDAFGSIGFIDLTD